MPVFERILKSKSDNKIIADLTFDLCMVLSLGKLRLHIPNTVAGLGAATAAVGASVRTYAKKVCPRYVTVELPKELAARGRRKARLTMASHGAGQNLKISSVRKRKEFNYQTYKFHALRDYAPAVKAFGSLDNCTAQMVRISYLSLGV